MVSKHSQFEQPAELPAQSQGASVTAMPSARTAGAATTSSLSHITTSPLRNWTIVLSVLAVGLIITVAAGLYMKSNEDMLAEREFISNCEEIQNKISARLDDHARILLSGRALFGVIGAVTREEWRIFNHMQRIGKQLPGIQGVGFALLIPQAELPRHIQAIRNEGFPEYKVKPECEREIYSSIIYLEPFTDRNLRAFGYDMLSEPVRRTAMERARDTDSATLSGKVLLVQETDKNVQAGNLMYVPVYRKGMPTNSLEQRRAAIYGWVYSPYRMTDMIKGVLGRHNLEKQRIHLEVFDGERPSSQCLLYENLSAGSRHSHPDRFTRQSSLDFNGHRWTLHFCQTGSSFFSEEYAKVWLVLFGGTITSLFLSWFLFSLLNTRLNVQRLAEQLSADLQDSSARLVLAVKAGGVGLWDYDVSNNKLIWDDQMFNLYGITREQFTGTYEAMTAGVHPEDQERGDKEIKMALHGEKKFDTEFRVLWPDGSIHDIRALASVQRNAAGQAVHMVGTNWDITERKRATKEIKLKNEVLQKVNAEKDKFFSIIAHDLRSPFQGFLGMTQEMAEELPRLTKDEMHKIAVCMRDSATNLFHLIEGLLQWASVQQGLIPFKPEVVQLLPIINESIAMVLKPAQNKGIEITHDIPDDIKVLADSNMLQSVIRNLVSNAIKFTAKSGKISLASKVTDNNTVEISVKDSGIGMDKTMQKNLFRLDAKTNRKGTEGEPSTGLGLLLCKEFTEKNGGRIWAESEESKGSTFYFTLPYSAVAEKNVIENVVQADMPADEKEDKIKNLKILIAEDDEKSDMLITKAVNKFTRELLKVKTGAEVVEACRNNPDIDLVLMDIAMPEMNGYEATGQIRQFNKNVVIIAQTAYALAEAREKAIAAGCNDYIAKPYNKTSLTALLKKYF